MSRASIITPLITTWGAESHDGNATTTKCHKKDKWWSHYAIPKFDDVATFISSICNSVIDDYRYIFIFSRA